MIVAAPHHAYTAGARQRSKRSNEQKQFDRNRTTGGQRRTQGVHPHHQSGPVFSRRRPRSVAQTGGRGKRPRGPLPGKGHRRSDCTANGAMVRWKERPHGQHSRRRRRPTIETVADNRIRFEAPTAKAMDHPTTFNLPLCQTVHTEDTYPSPAGSVYREFGLVSPDRRELEPDRRGGLGMVVWR